MSNERQSEVKTIRHQLFCDCGGEMLPTGYCLTSFPPQYPHICSRCGKEQTIRGKEFPYITYEEVARYLETQK